MNSLFRQSKTYPFTENLLTALESRLFYKQKAFLLHKPRLAILKSQAFPQAQSFLFAQTFPYHHSKHPFSALHLPLAPSHNLLSAKNTAVLLSFALNPHAVTLEPRTDSKPFRRRFVRKNGFDSCCRKTSLKSSSTEL